MLFNMNNSHSANLKHPIFLNQIFLTGLLYHRRKKSVLSLDWNILHRLFLVEDCKDASHFIHSFGPNSVKSLQLYSVN